MDKTILELLNEAGLTLSILILLALLIVQRPDSIFTYTNGDAVVFINHITRLSDDWMTIGQTRDPLLRYVPLALSYTLFETLASAETISYYTVGIFSNILFPTALWILFSKNHNRLAAHATVFAVIADRLVRYTKPGILRGTWQYDMILPLIILAIILGERTIQAQTKQQRDRYAIFTGIVLGFAGLQQLTLTAIAVLSILIHFFYSRQYRPLLLTSCVGATFTLGFIFQPQSFIDHLAGRLASDGSTTTIELTGAIGRLVSEGNLILWVAILMSIYFWRQSDTEFKIADTLLLISGLIVFIAVAGNLSYFSFASRMISYPLVVGSLIGYSVQSGVFSKIKVSTNEILTQDK